MALVLKDRVKETTTTTGTTNYTLLGAENGFEAFSVIGDTNTTYYCCTDGVDFEVGIGTYTSSGTVLARTTVLQSSNTALDISGDIDVDGTTNLDIVDIDGAVDMATTLQVDGVATFTGRDIHSGGITIANAGQIGSVGDLDAMAIASNGVVTFSQIPVLPANSINSDNYADGSIDNAHLADDAVGADELAANAVVNASVAAGAAINFSKMENLTTARALVSDGNGDVSVSAVTATEVGYLDGVTSAIQTQLNATASKGFATAMAIAL